MSFSFSNFKKAISFRLKGRATRSEFWSFFGFSFILMAAFFGPLLWVAIQLNMRDLLIVGTFALGFCMLFFGIVNIFVTTRRLHDVGWSGWPVGTLILPSAIGCLFPDGLDIRAVFDLINTGVWIWILFLCSRKSEPLDNKYGKVPID